MATPIEDVQIIQNYWRAAAATSPGELVQPGYTQSTDEMILGLQAQDAINAMADLVNVSSSDTYTRTAIFAGSSIFESALSSVGAATVGLPADEAGAGTTDWLVAQPSSETGISGSKPPRLVMLDGIYKAGAGGLISPKDPTGIGSWLNNPTIAMSAMASTIGTDPNPNVRASALRIIADLALPALWVKRSNTTFGADAQRGPIETAVIGLQASLPSSPWDQATRSTLSSLASQALGTFNRAQAVLAAAAAQAGHPGDIVMPDDYIIPAGPKPWYKNGTLLGTGFIGLIVGGIIAERQRSR